MQINDEKSLASKLLVSPGWSKWWFCRVFFNISPNTSFGKIIPPISWMCFKQPQMTKQDHCLFLAREESFPLKRRWFLVAKQVSGCSSVTHSGSHHRLSGDPGISGQYEQRGSPPLIKNTLPLVFLTELPVCWPAWSPGPVFAWLTGWHKGEKGTECTEARRNFLSCCRHRKHLTWNSDLSQLLPYFPSKDQEKWTCSKLDVNKQVMWQPAWTSLGNVTGVFHYKGCKGGWDGRFTDQPTRFWIICGLPLGSV